MNRTISACIRNLLGANNNTPIKIIKGKSKPHFTGYGWCYETRGGRPIRYPSSYSKVGWSNMVYVASTLCIEVGADYVLKYKKQSKYKNDLMLKKAFYIKYPEWS